MLATIAHLLDITLIRIGNDSYARDNDSYGITTLRNSHVRVAGGELRFQFKGKSGKTWRLQLKDRRIAKIVRACQELPGQHLFEYLDEDGVARQVTSTDVNAYLREITSHDITAKDFRTWSGTVLAALALTELQAAENGRPTKRTIKAAIERVAERLGNTVTVCRNCYVHPAVIEAYSLGELALKPRKAPRGATHLSAEEAAVLAMLQARLKRTLEGSLKESLVAVKKKAARKKAP